MLTAEQNERSTRVSAGTPMGELFRRYWQPVATCADLADDPIKQVRILGETLVLFRDRRGRLGLVAERCPHRGTALVYGIPEPGGLRCPYHGWLFDLDGKCIEQPDGSATTNGVDQRSYCITSYPVEDLGGLIWGNLGPGLAPPLPRWELLIQHDAPRSIGSVMVPCNWLQCMENGLDESHVQWLRSYFGNYMSSGRVARTCSTMPRATPSMTSTPTSSACSGCTGARTTRPRPSSSSSPTSLPAA